MTESIYRAELSAEAGTAAPEGVLVSYESYEVVDTPRVGVDGLRKALLAKYGSIDQPPA